MESGRVDGIALSSRRSWVGKEMAKVVVLEVDGRLVMGVIPGSQRINLNTAKASLGAKSVKLATEAEFISRFPECEIGAMPPFGNIYGVPTYVDKSLAEEDYIVFEAGTHTEAIRLNYRDYEKIVKPQVKDLAIKIQPMKGV